MEGVAWVVVEGFVVNDMPRTGIRTALSDHVTIRYNSRHSNYKWGILTGFAEHVVIEHNTCSGSEDEHGIYVSNSADDPIIRYNHLLRQPRQRHPHERRCQPGGRRGHQPRAGVRQHHPWQRAGRR
ncbi:MAG: right-handed parallel beta-helix repeat-containing protein [Flavobacteriales bacterium]|nr:right-handed parallel beta-helix repeat-containing protein [Flavobacteriales bacterium]